MAIQLKYGTRICLFVLFLQVKFNEAVSRVTAEKDKVVDDLNAQLNNLQEQRKADQGTVIQKYLLFKNCISPLQFALSAVMHF